MTVFGSAAFASVVGGTLLLAYPAAQAAEPNQPTQRLSRPHETRGDAPAPAGQRLVLPSEPAFVGPSAPGELTVNGFTSVQVNVDPNGRNIPGDAANEPTIAVDPRDPRRMVIGWRQFDSVQSNFREAGYAYSRNAGRSWRFPGVIEPGVFRTDPVLDIDPAGNFLYHSLTIQDDAYICHLFRSQDGGRTWGKAVYGYGGDKNWLVVDRTGLMGHGHIYAVWQRFFGCCEDRTFTRSIDHGGSFQPPVRMPSSPTFGTLTVGPDGTVYAAGIEAIDFQNFEQFVVSRSADARDPGRTPVFSTVQVNLGGAMGFGEGPNPDGLTGQAQVLVDHSHGPRRGWVYVLCSVHPRTGDAMDVHLIRSADGGQTWSAPVRVNDDPPQAGVWNWFGTIGIAPSGRLDVVWNDNRENASRPYLVKTYYSYSLDGGVSWSPSVAISPLWDSFRGFPAQYKIGDYYQVVSDDVGANLAYAATHNGEQDVYYVRLGEPDCNGNGVPDALDLQNQTSTDLNGNGVPDECDCLGDLDCSGRVDFGDVNPFVLALAGREGYEQQYPDCEWLRADGNGDGAVNFADINVFVELLAR